MIVRMVTRVSSLPTSIPSIRYGVLVSVFTVLFAFTVSAFAQGGASTAQADLDQLVQSAQNIVRGQVISARIEPHPQFPNLKTLVITLSITKVLKGAAGSTLTFRQLQLDTRDASSMAGYKGAGEVLLFLNPVSQYGLTSTVGLEQGRFRVLSDGNGNRYVINGRANMGLFNPVSAKAAARGIALSRPVRQMLANANGKAALDPFEQAVQALAGAVN
jgi:hypothetical protein